ncbi:MAG TPA: hypothetical protein VGJ81_00725 [Thermoanaerobaculia bacterium]|jgi:hypothetical protein
MAVINTNSPTTTQAVDTPQPPAKITPEAVFEQLRTLHEQINEELAPLTSGQRRGIKRRNQRQTNEVVQSSINIIGVADLISQAVGMPAEAVRQKCDDSNRWTAVADELRAMLNGVEGANLVRQQQLADIAKRAYTIGSSLAGDPANVGLVPHVEETKRLKKLARRKKSAAPQNPQPAPSPATPAPGTPAPKA